MKYQYITIENETGSGGTEIANIVANECRLSRFGAKEILQKVYVFLLRIATNKRLQSRYYFFGSGKRWKDEENYDLYLDRSQLGISGCVDLIKNFEE